MPQILEKNTSFTWSTNQRTLQFKGVVLKRRHFQHTLLSGSTKNTKRMGSNNGIENPKPNALPLMDKVGPGVEPESSNSEERTSCTDEKPLLGVPRKYRMRDECGNLLPKKRVARMPASATWLPVSHMEVCSKLTLEVRSLKLGNVNLNFRGSVTFSVDYIEITNNVKIEASELTSCEWCRSRRLPALLLHMTDAAIWRLREQLVVSTDTETWDGCRSKHQQETYLLLIFESAPTVLEEAALEEIFAEIGRLKNLSNFTVNLTYEEARDRLTTRECFQANEVKTLSVSDDEDDLMECSSSHAETLVIYPPPPAKGGFSITNEDLHCLNEGNYLNDVIIDFYLKYLVCEKLQEMDANRFHAFSSFFYRSLTQTDLTEDLDGTSLSIQERRHNRVKTWTRHLDVFQKDFIFVPINQLAHWYLAVICFPGQAYYSTMDPCENKIEENPIVLASSSPFSNPMSLFYRHQTSKQISKCTESEDDYLEDDFQFNANGRYSSQISDITSKQPCILIMDSLGCGAKPAVVKVLQEYLEMEWRVRKGSLWSSGKQTMTGWSVQVPQQDNHTDCGVYVLQYVESFITNPPRNFHAAIDLRDWFPQELVKKKRERIKEIIFSLHHQQQAEFGE
ncbi:sentrin-specific protease 6 isoform X2 [Silurus meridionalis]|uniref:sentrin-specific protease 6 isoform X2 n=1 Tax=Silurus meridionalis TaxID=175797 RepID=UPI001EEC3D3B|nr:sentrin-specific protease 6 isoform X2 [Silurus meridionalis]